LRRHLLRTPSQGELKTFEAPARLEAIQEAVAASVSACRAALIGYSD
jgi:hypothetical protein